MNHRHADAQGFNWQYSARYATGYPRVFVGASVSGLLMLNSVALDHRELVASGSDCFCASYTKGRGVQSAIGFHGEWWLQSPDIVLYSDITYQRFTSILNSSDIDNGPILRAGVAVPVITRYEMDARLHFIATEIGVKYSFYPGHIFVAAGLNLAFRFSDVVQQQELVINPAEYRFLPKSGVSADGLSRTIEKNPAITSVIPALTLQAGIDLPLANGLYASPALMIYTPLSGLTSAGFWRWIAPGLKLSIMYGWNNNR